jgi:uncharacterized protein YcbX
MELDARGPRGDRRWMLVDPEGAFLSLRDVPRLCFVEAFLTGDGLRLEAPGVGARHVSRPEAADGARWIPVRVWDGTCRVLEADAGTSGWLSDALGVSCRLVYLPDDEAGPAADAYGEFAGRRREVALSDGAPLLLTSEASLADLNARLAAPVPMYRFRPNVVVGGVPAWQEEMWRCFAIGDVAFDAVTPCPRCVATTVDPATGTKGPEPLRTLATFRRTERGVNFGMNVAHRGTGTIRVGDAVHVQS